jgi:multidrug efflux pump subunit AcrA (membrane-fusion protein)
MKRIRTIFILLTGFLLITAGACGSAEETTTSTAAERDITVTGKGTIESSLHEALTFGSGGKIAQVAVKEGDSVKKGDVLAELETDTLEVSAAQAEAAKTQAEISLMQAEQAKIQAEVALTSAQFTLDLTEDVAEIKDAITELEWKIIAAKLRMREAVLIGTDGKEYWQNNLEKYEKDLAEYKEILSDLLSQDEYSGIVLYDIYGQKYDRVTLEDIRLKQLKVESAELAVSQAVQNINLAQKNLELAELKLAQARKSLAESTIVAPFDGVITAVPVKEGRFISAGTYASTTIVELYDLTHMVLTDSVSELDIVKVEKGQRVIITFDAIPDKQFEGSVSYISPVAKESELVLFEDEDEPAEYEVKIEINVPDGAPVMIGMSAEAEIMVE